MPFVVAFPKTVGISLQIYGWGTLKCAILLQPVCAAMGRPTYPVQSFVFLVLIKALPVTPRHPPPTMPPLYQLNKLIVIPLVPPDARAAYWMVAKQSRPPNGIIDRRFVLSGEFSLYPSRKRGEAALREAEAFNTRESERHHL